MGDLRTQLRLWDPLFGGVLKLVDQNLDDRWFSVDELDDHEFGRQKAEGIIQIFLFHYFSFLRVNLSSISSLPLPFSVKDKTLNVVRLVIPVFSSRVVR